MSNTLTRTMSWDTHRGQKILHANYQGLEAEDMADAVKENQSKIEELGRQGVNDLLVLTDVTDTVVDHTVVTAFMQVSSAMAPLTTASAVVGMGMGQTVMLKVVNSFSAVQTHPASSLDEARDWLAGQASA